MARIIEGELSAKDLKIAVVAARFNDFIVQRLIDGALDFLSRHGLNTDDVEVVRVPGAFELPLVLEKLAQTRKYDGLVALGAVIRGSTPHFDYVCAESVKGIAHVMLKSGIPVGFGVLTCDNLEQAIERAGAKAGNKGADAASAVVETIRVLSQIK